MHAATPLQVTWSGVRVPGDFQRESSKVLLLGERFVTFSGGTDVPAYRVVRVLLVLTSNSMRLDPSPHEHMPRFGENLEMPVFLPRGKVSS